MIDFWIFVGAYRRQLILCKRGLVGSFLPTSVRPVRRERRRAGLHIVIDVRSRDGYRETRVGLDVIMFPVHRRQGGGTLGNQRS